MASGQEHGTFRVEFNNTAESNKSYPFDFNTQIISGGALAAPTGVALTAIPTVYQQCGVPKLAGQRVICTFIAQATDIVESEECNWELPLIQTDLRSGIQTPRTVVMEQMTGFTAAGTVDVTATAAVPARLAYFDAPAGFVLSLNPNGKVRAYIGDDA